MSTIDELEERLFDALRDIDLQMVRRLPFEELKARYTAVGERLAPQFAAAGRPDLALDTRRLGAGNECHEIRARLAQREEPASPTP